jgi:outer membrane protein OmpA-like peptidoglycan-associated protein
MKRLFFVCIVLLFLVVGVQGQNYSSEITANFGSGASHLNFNLHQNGWKNSIRGGVNFGLGYTYYIPKSHFGIATGLEFASYNNKVLFPEGQRIAYNVPVTDGSFFVMEKDGGVQRFGTWMMHIPLHLRYLVPIADSKYSIYFQLGGQLGVPLSPFVTVAGAGNLEIGVRLAATKRFSVYLAAYGEYGFNNIKKNQSVAPEKLDVPSILLASNAVDKIHPVSFGVKIRVGFGFGKKLFSEEKGNNQKSNVTDNPYQNIDPKKELDKNKAQDKKPAVVAEINDNNMPYGNPEKVDSMPYSPDRSNIPDNKYHNGDPKNPIINPYDVNGNEVPDYREWGDNDDMDGDGIPNWKDPDIDGDGIPNENDKTPYGASSYRGTNTWGYGNDNDKNNGKNNNKNQNKNEAKDDKSNARPDESDLPIDPNNPLGIVKFDTPIIEFGEPSDVIITPYAREQMDELVKYLIQHPKYYVVVLGHTCDLGTKAQNLHVGLTRANNVAAYLVGRGISQNKIVIISKNALEPRVPNTSEANRRKNRRVEFKIRSVKPQ